MREKFVAAIALALAKLRFKRFSPIREERDVTEIAEIWVDVLIAERATKSELVNALDWLQSNKPEFPDIADVLREIRKDRSRRYSEFMRDCIGVAAGDGVIRLVAADSDEGRAELASREMRALEPTVKVSDELRERIRALIGEDDE